MYKVDILLPATGTAHSVLTFSPKYTLWRYMYTWQKKCVNKDEVVCQVGVGCTGKFSRKGLTEKLPK